MHSGQLIGYEGHGSELRQTARDLEGHTFGTAESPAASISSAARELIQMVIKVVGKIRKAPLKKAKFEDLQVQS